MWRSSSNQITQRKSRLVEAGGFIIPWSKVKKLCFVLTNSHIWQADMIYLFCAHFVKKMLKLSVFQIVAIILSLN